MLVCCATRLVGSGMGTLPPVAISKGDVCRTLRNYGFDDHLTRYSAPLSLLS